MALLPNGPHLHSGAALLRVGLGAAPRRIAPASRLVAERPFLLRQRPATRQLDLFGPEQHTR